MTEQVSSQELGQDPKAAFEKMLEIMTIEEKNKSLQPLTEPDDESTLNDKAYYSCIMEKRANLPQVVKSFNNELDHLMVRARGAMPEKQTQSFSSSFFNFIYGAKKELSVPTIDELIQFIAKVMKCYNSDFGPGYDIDGYFKDLLSRVNSLAMVMSVYFETKVLNQELSCSPLENLDKKEETFNEIHARFSHECFQSLLVDLNQRAHPLNKLTWQAQIAAMAADIKALKQVSAEFKVCQEKIDGAKVEADLPSPYKLQELEALIDSVFQIVTSTRAPAVRRQFLHVSQQIEAIKSKQIEQAKKAFARFDEQFTIWQTIISATRDGGVQFPWRVLPPSLKEVRVLTNEIADTKAYYEDWPCVLEVLSSKSYELIDYQKQLRSMKDETLSRINRGFADPNFSIRTLQHYIRLYKELLIKGGYDKAEDKISEVELQLFRFAHAQYKQSQWCSFFRRSYFDNFDTPDNHQLPTWHNVAVNMRGGSHCYTGVRTRKVMKELGWTKDDQWTNIAPKMLINCEEEYQASLGLL